MRTLFNTILTTLVATSLLAGTAFGADNAAQAKPTGPRVKTAAAAAVKPKPKPTKPRHTRLMRMAKPKTRSFRMTSAPKTKTTAKASPTTPNTVKTQSGHRTMRQFSHRPTRGTGMRHARHFRWGGSRKAASASAS